MEKQEVYETEEEPQAEEQTELFVKTVSVTYGRKFNLDNYESATLDVTMWADRATDGDLAADFAALWEMAKAQVKGQAMPLLTTRNKELEAKKAQEAKRLAPAPKPQPTIPPSTPPPAPPQPTATPEATVPQADNGAKTETFLVDSVTAQITPKQNRYYVIRGGRVKKFGAKAWPEVAALFVGLVGYDPENLEVGQPWDVAGYDITATAEIPAGKEYPTKVVNLTRQQ